MKKALLIFTVLLCFGRLYAQKFYKSTSYNYIIETPMLFDVTSKTGLDYFASDKSGATIVVSITKTPQGTSLETLKQASDNELRTILSPPMVNVKLLNRDLMSLNKRVCYEFTAEAGYGDSKIKVTTYMFFVGDHLYTLMLSYPLSDKVYYEQKVYSRVLSSFEIKY